MSGLVDWDGDGIYQMERHRQWRDRSSRVPFFTPREGWEIAVTPPFACADARFLVRQGKGRVSVYLDFDSRLGCMDEPYWEIYPDTNDSNARLLIDDTEGLVEGIAASLAKQNQDTP